ncbi:MAG: hypothetical protein ABI655_14800 [Phenylobacterium sp.]
MIVITRLVRVIHEHRMAQEGLRSRRCISFDTEIMGGPNKSGHDVQ